ncbi:helix-turn-helix transcriptional regulator [Aliiroseovarius sp.]|uniref:helix-turn-helix transcriptional regulator n=1 Tax=Aliiroseovarius sp. TaxID=1872442 RepID=UPI003BACFC7E
MAEFHRHNLTPSANGVLDMAHRLKGVTDADGIAEVLTEVIHPFGYDSFVYARIPTDADGALEDYVHLDTLDPDWMQHYLEHDMFRDDWLAQYCQTGTRAVLWSDVRHRIDTGQITGAEAHVMNSARDWGVQNGITLPLPCLGRVFAGISLVGDPMADQADQDRQFRAAEQPIAATLHVFHAGVEMGAVARDFYGLTRREIEVLKWQSEGFRTRDIALKLRTSVHTVEKQAKSARSRLNAASTSQAVAKAVLMGIID